MESVGTHYEILVAFSLQESTEKLSSLAAIADRETGCRVMLSRTGSMHHLGSVLL